mgnify:CR=1 FL=1
MAEDFYPFVNDDETGATETLVPRHPARIAVYDDASAAPRVVLIEPKDVRSYLEEITLQVTQLAQAQGGSIPFMVVREIVENLIHAYFIQPTVSILDHGNTIRFSDQGPGIRQKERALQYGTTSATEEMRRYIRGVGSGLPYVQQYMHDKGGSIVIEDNMSGGTVVTLSAHPASGSPQQPGLSAPQPPNQQAWNAQQPFGPQGYQQTMGYGPSQAWQQSPQGWAQNPQQPWQQQGMSWQQAPSPWQQQQPWQQPYGAPAQAFPATPSTSGAPSPSWPEISPRGQQVLVYLRSHESVGPSDLARTQGGSQPTWTRELQALEDQGLVRKDGQKRRLTGMGQAYLQQAPPGM